MTASNLHCFAWQAGAVCVALQFGLACGQEAGTGPQRTPWTTSRVVGSPEPPPPFVVAPYLTGIAWDRPLYAKAEPGTDNLFLVEQGGERDRPSRIYRVRDVADASERELVLEVDGRLIYGVEFHPDYDGAGELFVFSNGPTPEPERRNRVSRYTVPQDERRFIDPESELAIIEWRSMGHDGGDLAFGRDGMLYISSGDGTSDSDLWLSAQDPSNLLGAILRIDVSAASEANPYAIPSDNPFLEIPGARGELWAIGLRNPWRMSADRRTGDLWVGVNGQDLWETAHLVRRGENYGWSVYEGSHPFYVNRQRGPGDFVAPTIEHHHIDFRSLTGGVAYYGAALPTLEGVYVYGDYGTGKIWGARQEDGRLTWNQELADTSLLIAGFAESPRGELLVVDHGGGIYHLIPNESPDESRLFPRRLSETGLFASVGDHAVAPGVLPYEVNAPAWSDGATAERFLALPGALTLGRSPGGAWNLPDGAVVMQTLSLGDGEHARRVETRLLTRRDGEWAGYSYRWSDAQDDAVLVARDGEDLELTWPDGGGGTASQTWRFPARAECLSCHSRASGFLLGLSDLQMNRPAHRSFAAGNQLEALSAAGYFDSPGAASADAPRLVDPYDESLEVEPRVRSYLHVNCSGCHVQAGGGNARMELGFNTSRDAMQVIDAHPQHDRFGVERARLVSPGEPEESVLLMRLSRRGRGQMPPLGTRVVDQQAVRLVHDWIADMPPTREFVRAWGVDDFPASISLADGNPEGGRELFGQIGCRQCHRVDGEGGGAGPDLSDVAGRLSRGDLVESLVAPSAKVAPEYASTILVLRDGRVIQGRVERETEQELVLRTADAFADPLSIDPREVDHRSLSQQSTMPSGLLDTLHAEEVLDLLAYLSSLQASPTSN